MGDIETQVAILNKDMTRMTIVFDKLETAIEKMGDVSNSIARLLAVHEEKLSKHEQVDAELFVLVEKRNQEMQSCVKELHNRITIDHRELTTDISETEERLTDALKEGLKDLKQVIIQENATTEAQRNEHEKRIRDLEKWRWIIFGGSVVVGMFAKQILEYASLITP